MQHRLLDESRWHFYVEKRARIPWAPDITIIPICAKKRRLKDYDAECDDH